MDITLLDNVEQARKMEYCIELHYCNYQGQYPRGSCMSDGSNLPPRERVFGFINSCRLSQEKYPKLIESFHNRLTNL